MRSSARPPSLKGCCCFSDLSLHMQRRICLATVQQCETTPWKTNGVSFLHPAAFFGYQIGHRRYMHMGIRKQSMVVGGQLYTTRLFGSC